MIKIDLTPELHAFAYECLLTAQGIKATEVRLFDKLMTKFEVMCETTPEPPYLKLKSACQIELEDAEHNLMSTIIKGVEFTSKGARIAAASFHSLQINA
jgi:hypothetical protein